jgi:subtilase family serine protease
MKFQSRFGVTFGMATALAAMTAQAAPQPDEIAFRVPAGTEVIPASNFVMLQGRGRHAHTNLRILFPGVRAPSATPTGRFETPASLACVYGLVKPVKGCNPATVSAVPATGSKVIAIVDAYDDPTAVNDLTVYSQQFHLPAITGANFQVVYAAGTRPPADVTGGWELEESLDIEMAHALAPNATIILVEAKSVALTDIYQAETVAANLVSQAGGGEVSNSFSAMETSDEESLEATFSAPGVVFLASAGDEPGIGQPAALQNVIAVGGTTINRDEYGNFFEQSAWLDTGGGSSAYVPVPAYQAPVSKLVGNHRGTPDMSLVADPASGVWVYDTTAYEGTVYQWLGVGGTSAASPATAGILNSAGMFAQSTAAELQVVYTGFKKKANWTDIKVGACESNAQVDFAVKGWDFCSGVGTPFRLNGK